MMRTPRLHVEDLNDAAPVIELTEGRAHYLRHVLRLSVGDPVRLFSAEAGEHLARIRILERRRAVVELERRLRPPIRPAGPDLWFAPIRRTRLEWMVEKATELGVRRLVPVHTRHTVVELRRPERLHAIAEEAAEQCERLDVPTILPPRPLFEALAAREPSRPLLCALERSDAPTLLGVLQRLETAEVDVLIGPEGGFAAEERARLCTQPAVLPVSLGPTVLRSETAALFALSCVRAVTENPRCRPNRTS